MPLTLLLAAMLAAPPEQPKATPVLLYDGKTTFGWNIEGDSQFKDGELVLGGGKDSIMKTDAVFPVGTITAEFKLFGGVGEVEFTIGDKPIPARLRSFNGSKMVVQSVTWNPGPMASLFNGKDLTGWKIHKDADPKRNQSKWSVTDNGELQVTNGPGDLQTEKKYGNFFLQLECKTLGKNLNSGVFFRCLPDEYQQGYEVQINNAFNNDDRDKPTDYGTGAVYRRIAARRVVANDNEWFTLSVLANGDRITTWVDGIMVTDWQDTRTPNENPRQGLKTEAGHISIQGHDPTTNILFRNIRIITLPKGE